MTIDALESRVRAQQWEAILVLLQFAGAHLPSVDGVAAFAIRAELVAMNVGVAIGTARAGVFKDKIRVALGAGNFRVRSTQRERSAVVIEFRQATNGLPTCARMAVLAGNANGSVGVPARLRLVPLRELGSEAPTGQQHREEQE